MNNGCIRLGISIHEVRMVEECVQCHMVDYIMDFVVLATDKTVFIKVVILILNPGVYCK